ncbi:hypothetical protein B0H12DRAFT_1153511 [Mycena haematopus]|nr:hypothetical protein B0H12DRAFT_1153511 [Mycena haematopus]
MPARLRLPIFRLVNSCLSLRLFQFGSSGSSNARSVRLYKYQAERDNTGMGRIAQFSCGIVLSLDTPCVGCVDILGSGKSLRHPGYLIFAASPGSCIAHPGSCRRRKNTPRVLPRHRGDSLLAGGSLH